MREGVVRDSGINAVSLLTSLLGDRRLVVTVATLDRPPEREAEISARFDCSFDGGTVHVSLEWEYWGAEQRTVIVRTSTGSYLADITHGTVDKDGTRQFSAIPAPRMLQAEYERMIAAFASAVGRGRCVASPAELMVLEELYQRAGRV